MKLAFIIKNSLVPDSSNLHSLKDTLDEELTNVRNRDRKRGG